MISGGHAWHLAALLGERHPAHAMAVDAAHGDPVSAVVLMDVAEEEGLMQQPFQPGKCYLVCMQTLYYVGRVARVGPGWVELETASWVHWTGRLSTLLKRGFTPKGWPGGHSRPRTEFCGTVGFSLASWSSYYPWPHSLPEESLTQ